MPAVPGVTNNGVILRGLSSLPSATEMLTVDPTGVMGRQAIPVGSFGSLTGSPSDNAALAAALAGKVSLSGDTMTGELRLTALGTYDKVLTYGPSSRNYLRNDGVCASDAFVCENARQVMVNGAEIKIGDTIPIGWTLGTAIPGTVDASIRRNATGPSLETRSAGGLRVRVADGSFSGSKINVQQWDSPETTNTFIRHDYNGMTLYGCTSPVSTLVCDNQGWRFQSDLGLKIRNQANSAAGPLNCGTITLDNPSGSPSISTYSNAGITVNGMDGNPGALRTRDTILGTTGYLYWNARALMTSSANGVVHIQNYDQNDTLADQALAFGPATLAGNGMRLKRAMGSTTLQIRNGNDSAAGALDALTYTSNKNDDSGVTPGFGWVDNAGAIGMAQWAGQNRLYFVTKGARRVMLNDSAMYLENQLAIGASMANGSNGVYLAKDINDTTLAQRNGVNPQTFRVYNTYTSATNGEWLQQQWTSNEARIGTAVGSAGGTQRNTVLGGWNAAGTWVPAVSIRPTDSAYPVKFHGSSGIWVGDQTTYEGGRIWSSVNAWGIANASSSYGTGAMNLTGWNGNTLQLQGGMQNTTNLSFAIDTDNNDPTSAFYFLAGVDNSGNPATNGLVKFEKSGNVGIGTMSPSARLHVNGSIMGSTKLLFSGTTGSDYGVINATGTRLIFGRNSTSDSIITVGMNPTAGQAGLTFRRGEGILWSGSTTSSEGGGVTAGVLSPSADVVEINNGTAGQLRDLSCRTATTSGEIVLSDISGGNIRWASGSRIYCGVNGRIALYQSNLAGFDLLQFGGTSNLFPAWKRSGATIQARLADDSNFARVTTGNLTITDATLSPQVTLGNGYLNDDSGSLWLGHSFAHKLGVNATQVTSLVPIVTSQTITHGFQPLVANPSTVDITNGLIRAVKNTTSGELRFWANDGNVMKSVLFS